MFFEMGKDRVANVKIKFCDAVPTFMSIINKNKDTEDYLQCIDILTDLKDDLDKDVSDVSKWELK
jgi:hypothetical protein